MAGYRELRCGELTLCKYEMQYAQLLYENLGCDPEMVRYTGWNPYASLASTKGFVSGIIAGYEGEDSDYSWIIKMGDEVVGIIGAYDYDEEEQCIEIGYSVFRAYWGQGIASRAVALVKEFLMSEEGIKKLVAWSAAENVGSRKVLENAGFVQIEMKEAGISVDGDVYDQVFFESK